MSVETTVVTSCGTSRAGNENQFLSEGPNVIAEPSTDRSDVLVLGAGIIGICCALSLQERGLTVMLVDRGEPGMATSYGNAGVISPWSCVPQCLPGMWKNIPKWLIDPYGPVRVRWRDLPSILPWTLQFLGNTRIDRVEKIADGMDYLMRENVQAYRHYLKGTGHEHLLRDSWFVNAFRGDTKLNLDDLPWKLRADRGAPLQIISASELRELEPAISNEYHSAILIKDQARAMAPGDIGRVLAEKFMRQKGRFVRGVAREIKRDEGSGFTLVTDDGTLKANKLVLASGIWSAEFLKSFGLNVPLAAERGYHLEFSKPKVELNNSVMDVAGKFIASSMSGGVRVAGTAEFAHVDAPPNYARARMLQPLAKRLLPDLGVGEVRQWMGIRPSFPDNLPAVGEVPSVPGLYAAFGHSHYGLGMAPATARLIAADVCGETVNAPRQAFAIERFQ